MSVVSAILRVVAAVGREVRWIFQFGGWGLRFAAVGMLGWWLAGLMVVWAELWFWLPAWAGVSSAVTLWARLWPLSWDRLVADRLVGRWECRRFRSAWPDWMVGCSLSRVSGRRVLIPQVASARWRSGSLTVRPQLLPGQTVDDLDLASERLRFAAGARVLRVIPNGSVTGCSLVFGFGDELSESFPVVMPDRSAAVDLRRVVSGRDENGNPWMVRASLSTLVVGATGAGKASVMWSVMFGLGPGIRSGLVRVEGIDLKGGMELSMGSAMCTRYASDVRSAVIMIEEAAAGMQDRARQLAGLTRQHTPSVEMPLVVVLVDELAALVAYVNDRELLRRAETALTLLLTQGRAVGYVVWGFAQDPRRETIAMRHLFSVLISLRLRSREEVTMVLGDGALAAGATAHRIPIETPGVGYVLADGRPVKVRAGMISDELIGKCAHRFPAPFHVPIVVPPIDAGSSRRR